MKKFSLVMFGMMVILSSCEKISGDGPVVNESRNIINFDGVDLRVAADVYFKQDANFKVEISAQRNILEVMETYVSNNKLVIKFKNDVRVRTHDPIIVQISAPSSSSFRLSGSGNINVTGVFSPSAMELDISGSGNITIPQLTTGYLDASISGSGNITVNNGTATEEKLEISGSGTIDLLNVVSDRADIKTSGSGDTKVNATKFLNVKISGSGSVYYRNNPIINSSISGSGKVIHI
ncbi:MAG: head GIN domain-containing protein [Flavisolibacter sp.]